MPELESRQYERVDEHQRRVWGRMIEVIDDYEAGVADFATLCCSLKGLLGASDLHDQRLVSELQEHFIDIDIEHELRTEGWEPPSADSDERITRALARYRTWATSVLATTDESQT